MNWLVGAILGGIVGLIAQAVAMTISRRYADGTRKAMRHLRLKWGQAGRGTQATRSRPAAVLPEYFREAGPDTIDIAIFELSLRPRIPLMDLLYFEYLKSRLFRGSIDRLVVAPWSGNDNTPGQRAEHELAANLQKVFGKTWSKVTLVTSADLAGLSAELLSYEFMKSLEALGDSSFLAQISSAVGYRVKSYRDINSGHPEALPARSLIEHAIRGWLMYKYLDRHIFDDDSGKMIAVGILIWERELAKLLLPRNLQLSGHRIHPGLMLGRSITYRKGFRRVPMPNYESASAIEIFASADDLRAKCAAKSTSELSTTNDVVEAILAENRYGLDLAYSRASSLLDSELTRSAETTYHSILTLRRMYGLG
jgi:hypothetical protein